MFGTTAKKHVQSFDAQASVLKTLDPFLENLSGLPRSTRHLPKVYQIGVAIKTKRTILPPKGLCVSLSTILRQNLYYKYQSTNIPARQHDQDEVISHDLLTLNPINPKPETLNPKPQILRLYCANLEARLSQRSGHYGKCCKSCMKLRFKVLGFRVWGLGFGG